MLRLVFIGWGLWVWGVSSAAAQVERRDPFSAEVAIGAAWSGSPTAQAGRVVDGGGVQVRVSAFAPYEDGLQGGAGAILGVDTAGVSRASALLGLRFLSGFAHWQTRVDVQLIADVWPAWGIGGRIAFGGLWRVARGVRMGAEFGGVFVAGNLRMGADGSLVLVYNW